MPNKFNTQTTALIVGLFAAAIHLVWSILVLFGLAQSYLDWILYLHFLNNPYTVSGFNLTSALTLIIVTFVVGYILGYVLATIGNYVIKRSKK